MGAAHPNGRAARGLALVVDDERSVRELVRAALEAEGFDVDEADTGAGALERVIVEPRPDVIVLDVMMPGIDGWEVLRRMKADSDHAVETTPVVMLTARSGEIDRVRAGIEGAVRYVTKPFALSELVRTIQDAVAADEPDERRRARSEALSDLARIEKEEAGASADPGAEAISDRQREIVLAVVRHGRVNAASTALGVSRNSVYAGLRRAAWRLGLSGTDELLAMARDRVGPFR